MLKFVGSFFKPRSSKKAQGKKFRANYRLALCGKFNGVGSFREFLILSRLMINNVYVVTNYSVQVRHFERKEYTNGKIPLLCHEK